MSTYGAAAGFRPTRTLTVRTELLRQLSRRRTRLTLALMVVLPVGLVAAFVWGRDGDSSDGDFFGSATESAANFTVFSLAVSQTLLLAVVVALFFGDAVASEASWGSLRYLLAVPVPRARLLGTKVVVSVLSSLTALLTLTVTSVAAGTVAFGWRPLQTPTGAVFGPGQALLRIAAMTGYVFVALLVIAALAAWLSTRTDAPLAAVGGAVLLVVVSGILDQVSALGDLRSVLPTHYSDAWRGLFTDPMLLEDMSIGSTSALLYAAVFFSAAWWHFGRKDILS